MLIARNELSGTVQGGGGGTFSGNYISAVDSEQGMSATAQKWIR
jgi:hypothetical protein